MISSAIRYDRRGEWCGGGGVERENGRGRGRRGLGRGPLPIGLLVYDDFDGGDGLR